MKKYYTIFFTTIVCLSTTYSQKNPTDKIKGEFVSFWAQTIWSYEFSLDNTYKYQTSGHFGNTITTGQYRIYQDTITLTAFPQNQQRDTSVYFKTDTLIIDSNDCLIDLSMGYEHLRVTNKNDAIYSSKKRNLKLPGRPIIIEN